MSACSQAHSQKCEIGVANDESGGGAENRGAVGAEGWGLGRGVLLPNGGGVWEGAMPPPQKFFKFSLSVCCILSAI